MHLKISAPWWVVFDWVVSKVTIPTYSWEITILPWHQPLSSVIKTWVVSFETTEDVGEGFVVTQNKVNISVSKWILLVDGENVLLTTSAATSSPTQTQEVLQNMSSQMEEDLAKIRDEGNAEDLEKALENMEKIQADIKLIKLRNLT